MMNQVQVIEKKQLTSQRGHLFPSVYPTFLIRLQRNPDTACGALGTGLAQASAITDVVRRATRHGGHVTLTRSVPLPDIKTGGQL